jgi:hypothetical protein
MPTETPSQAFEGAFAEVPTQLLKASRDAVGATAELYLDSIDTVARFQRSLVAGTPLQPLSDAVSTQTDVAREVVRAYVSAGDEAVRRGRETAEVADEAATRVARGTTRAARKATRRSAGAVRRAATTTARAAASAPAAPTAPTGRRTPAAGKPAAAAAKVVEPPITGYDALTAEELVVKLPELPQAVLVQVVAYETANGGRSTVLDRVNALTGPEPAPGYDELTVEDVQALLSGADDALATAVRDYERRHKGRAGVLEAAERQTDAS